MLTLKEHHGKLIAKHEANTRLLEITDCREFLKAHDSDDFNAELEDIPQLLTDATYEWHEEGSCIQKR